MELLHGLANHPQTKGIVERYNRTIKDLMKNSYLDAENNNKVFNLEKELSDVINAYNNSKHACNGYSPNFLFNCKNDSIFAKSKKI